MLDFSRFKYLSVNLKAFVSIRRANFKEKNLICLQMKDKPKIFILGTVHDHHLKRKFHYSFANVLNIIKNVKPDVVLLETRNETFTNFDAIDGPIEMSVCYSYCHEQNISVGFIDWWQLSDMFKHSSNLEVRDDHIFLNIQNLLKNTEASKIVLLICGEFHLSEQKERFLNIGYDEKELVNTIDYFVSDKSESFTYPKSLKDDIERKITYYKNGFEEEIEKNITDEPLIEKMKTRGDNIAGFYQSVLREYIIPNKLYK